jgi:hypothetical protein
MEPPCGSMSARARASNGSMMVLRFPSLMLESSTSVRPSLCMARWRSLSLEDWLTVAAAVASIGNTDNAAVASIGNTDNAVAIAVVAVAVAIAAVAVAVSAIILMCSAIARNE